MGAPVSPRIAAGLGDFARALRVRFGDRIRELVLFGSRARGDAHEDSDVDVLVVVDGLSDWEKREVSDIAYDVNASSEHWIGISPLACSTAEVREHRLRGRRIWHDIAAEGLCL